MKTKLRNSIKNSRYLFVFLGVLVAGVILAAFAGSANEYHTVKVEYKYSDNSDAYDPYTAVLQEGEDVDLTVTNPIIPGYKAMDSLGEGAQSALTTDIDIPELTEDYTVTVYYVPDLVHYKVRYFKQNINDDLYTEDLSLPNSFYEKTGYTGTYPDELEHMDEDEHFEGFTSLFHEPDIIAADGSTVFKMYFDRDYTLIDFDLGDKGYGVEPVYAKNGTTFNIGTPKRVGYGFTGWCKANENGDYVDSEGNVLTDKDEIDAAAETFTSGIVPIETTYYKAVWEPQTTKYSIVYWIQNTDSKITAEEVNAASTLEASQALIAQNYSVVAAKDVWNVDSGAQVNLDTTIKTAAGDDVQIKNFFDFNLNMQGTDSSGNPKTVTLSDGDPLLSLLPDGDNKYPVDNNNKKLDFPTMSNSQRAALTDNKKNYYTFSESMSALQFSGSHEGGSHEYIEVAGDGTTRINVYYDRIEYKLQFFFAKTKKNATTNKITEVHLTSRTGNYSNTSSPTLTARLNGATWKKVSDLKTLPEFSENRAEYIGEPIEYPVDSTTSYWYYEIKTRYEAKLDKVWFNDAFQPVEGKGIGGKDIIFTSWATENGTNYQRAHSGNSTVKGYYEKFEEQLMFPGTTSPTGLPVTELHFVASWARVVSGDNSNVQNFTYKNYVEILPYEQFLADQKGDDFLINGGDYDAGTYGGNSYREGHYDGRYTDIIVNNDIKYGLLSQNTVNTYDWGNRYTDKSTRDKSIRDNQTTVALMGFEPVPDGEVENIYPNCGNHNPQSTWYAANGFDENNHADILYFYRRNQYKIKYRNFNKLEHQYNAHYNAPLNLKKFEYTPVYPNEDLKDYYTFDGWYMDPFHLQKADFSTMRMPADDLTLYAKWKPVTNKVTFYNDYKQYSRGVKVPSGQENPYKLHDVDVDYDAKIDTPDVPSVGSTTHTLVPPDKNHLANFAGWYYLDGRKKPVRFDPETIPVTGELNLYAEWVSDETAKYRVRYVDKETGEDIATPTTGTLFVTKTKTFTAKTSSQLDEAHKWSPDRANWYPTLSSHSILIEENEDGKEFAPNEFEFEYIQKPSVWYEVHYIDSTTGRELLPHGKTRDDLLHQTNYAAVTEKAPYIHGYVANELTQSLVLSASLEEDPDTAKAEELRNNVITFFYTTSDTATLYQINHYVQSLDDPDSYELYYSENVSAQIDDVVTVATQVHDTETSAQLAASGYTLMNDKTTVEVDENLIYDTDEEEGAKGGRQVVPETVTLTGAPTIFSVYYDRNSYNYTIKYVDYEAEYKHDHEGAAWDGELYETTVTDDPNALVGKTVDISAPAKYQYDDDDDAQTEAIHYSRISDRQLNLVIRPDKSTPEINVIKVYYKRDSQKKLTYEIVCDVETREEFATLSRTREAVESQDEINGSEIYLTDSEELDGEYEFLGWFSTPDPIEEHRLPGTTSSTYKYVPELPGADMTYYAVFSQRNVSMTVDVMYNNSGVYDPTDTDDLPVIDVDGKNTGYKVDFQSPRGYISGSETPLAKNNLFEFSINRYDSRLYKYEFAGWYEIDPEDSTHIIEHHDIVTTTVNNEHRDNDYHYIAMFRRKPLESSVDYEIRYQFNTRSNGTQSFVKKGTMFGDDLAANLDADTGAYEFSDTYLLQNAPYESNHGETLCWTDKQIEKNSNENTKKLTTIVTAEQKTQKVYAHYRLTADGEYSTIQTLAGSHRGMDPQLEALDLRGNENFSYWEIRQTETGPVIAKCYDEWFTCRIYSNYYISPVFNASEEESSSANVHIAKIDYSRNRWTDEEGNVNSNGTTDLLYSDYEISFSDGGTKIQNNSDYTIGVVFELCDQLADGDTFTPDSYTYVSNYTKLGNAALDVKNGGKPTSYIYDEESSLSRKIQINQVPTSKLTNMDRLNFGKYYKNSHKTVNGEEVYTNKTAIMKVTAYMIDKDNHVTMSNSVYVCLNDIGNRELAKDYDSDEHPNETPYTNDPYKDD